MKYKLLFVLLLASFLSTGLVLLSVYKIQPSAIIAIDDLFKIMLIPLVPVFVSFILTELFCTRIMKGAARDMPLEMIDELAQPGRDLSWLKHLKTENTHGKVNHDFRRSGQSPEKHSEFSP